MEPDANAQLAEAKGALREQMRELRRAIPRHERARRSRIVAGRTLALAELASPRTVLVFYAFGSEVGTRDLIAALADRGHQVLLPVIRGTDLLAARFVPDAPIVVSPLGVKEPASPVFVDAAEVGAVIAPGLAFDRAGHRLGHGGGHYDRFLATLSHSTLRLGIAFHEQLVDAVPFGPQDQRLHLVVTDREVVDRRRATPA